MKVIVDRELCCSYGFCVETVPQVFSFDADTNLVVSDEIAEDLQEKVKFACGACPAGALKAEE